MGRREILDGAHNEETTSYHIAAVVYIRDLTTHLPLT